MDIKRYAVIEDGIVVNVAVATPEYAESQGWVEHVNGVGIGYGYSDGNFFPILRPRNIEQEWIDVRRQRDQLLVESDPIVSIPDRWSLLTQEKQQEWLDYRQLLRDIPQTYEDPKDIIWPVKPT